MGFRSTLTEWQIRLALALMNKVNPIGQLQVVNTGMDHEQPWPEDKRAHLAVYMVDVYAYAAITAIAMDVAATPLLVQKQATIDGELKWKTQTDGELFDLFNKVNLQQETWSYLTEQWVSGLMAAGDSYMLFDPQDQEFYYGRPDWVHVTADQTGRVTGYNIANSGLTVNQEPPDIIHLKLSNPSGAYYGMPPSQVIKASILTGINLDRYLNMFFKNNAMTGAVFQTDQKLSVDQRKEIEKSVRTAYAGIDNAFKSVILEGGAKMERLTYPLSELIPKEIDDRIMRKVLAAYNVPPVKIGSLDGASYANANKQDELYERGTVEPRRRNIETAITMQFVQPKFGTEWRVIYDRSQVQGLQEDRNEKSKRTRGEFKDGLIKLNEARETLGYDPVEEEEGGNEFFAPQASIMLNPDGSGGVGDQGDDDQQRQIPGSYAQKCQAFKLTKAGEQSQRDKHERRLTKKEKKFAKIITAYFNGQVNRLIERLNAITSNGKIMSHLLLYVGKDNDEIPDRLFNLEDENDILTREVGISIRAAVDAGANEAIADFTLPLDFNPNDPSVQIMVENFAQKITIINDFSRGQVRQLLTDAVDRGDSVPEIASSLREMYSGWTDKTLDHNRALRIARTEMNGFVNAGASEAYLQAGLKKEWLATLDGSTRPEHIVADGQVVGVKESFDVGGEMLRFPADPAGSPGNIINCRCSMIPVVPE